MNTLLTHYPDKIISGHALAQPILAWVKAEAAVYSAKQNHPLTVIDFYDPRDRVAVQYARVKQRAANRVGIRFAPVELPSTHSDYTVSDFLSTIDSHAANGILVQLPLRAPFNQTALLQSISAEYDIDCLNPQNETVFYRTAWELNNRFLESTSRVLPYPTVQAILYILEQYVPEWRRLRIGVVGNGQLVGKPLIHILKNLNVSFTRIDRATQNPAAQARGTDILITATGVPGLITSDWIHPQTVVIDAGTSDANGSITGDVEYESVLPNCSKIAPTPGGVGPLTVAMLLRNAVCAVQNRL